jgi:hypothetical protein
MKNLSLTKGRQPTKAERKVATQEQAERRAAAPFMPAKPKRKPLPRKPGKGCEPVKIYTAAEVQRLIESRPDLQKEMAVPAQDK